MRLRHSVGFAAFCALAGSRWLAEVAWPQTLPPLLGQSLHDAAAGCVALVAFALRKNKYRSAGTPTFSVMAAGLLFLGVPALLQQFASATPPETSVALYGIAPLCVVGIVMSRDEASRALMMPALAGLAGLLLVLPLRLPSTVVEMVSCGFVLAAVVLSAIGVVWAHGLVRAESLMRTVAVIALSNAALLGSAGVTHHERLATPAWGDVVALLLDGASVFLLVWLVGAVAPERFASRFFLVPLIALVEGAVLLRASPDARMTVGILLLMAGAGLLLRSRGESAVSLGLK